MKPTSLTHEEKEKLEAFEQDEYKSELTEERKQVLEEAANNYLCSNDGSQ